MTGALRLSVRDVGVLLGLLLGLAAPCGAAAWASRASLADPRQEVAVAALDGRVYVMGGFRSNLSIADTVEVYDPQADAWSFAAPLPVALHHAAAAAVDGTLYVVGGWSNFFGTPTSAVWAYDPQQDLWSARAPMPTARAGLAVAALDGKLYAAGGSPAARERDFAVYDVATGSWTPLPLMPTPRNHLAAGAVAGRFQAVGGRSGGIGGITGALEEFDPATGVWTPRAPMPTPRGGIGAAVVGGYLVVFGGEGNAAHPQGVFEEVEAWEPGSNAWTTLTPMPTPRHGIGAAVLAGLVHVPGGGPVEGFGVTGVHEVLDPGVDLLFCDDGLDNDADGLADAADPGCDDALDASERSPLLPCDDGANNDTDAFADFPADPGCRNPTWLAEDPECQDGEHNDGDGKMDFDGGLSVHGVALTAPDPQCGAAWRARERSGCGLGFELVGLVLGCVAAASSRPCA